MPISPCSTSTVARASESARWLGVVVAPNRVASELSLQLGASSRVITRRASFAVSSTSKPGHGRPCRSAKNFRNPTSNGALWATRTQPVGELEELGEHLVDRRCRRDHRVGDAGQHGDERRDQLVRVDQGLELSEDLAAADLHGADLGDHRAILGRAAGRLEVDDAERDVGEPATELVEAALRLPTRPAWPRSVGPEEIAVLLMNPTLGATTDQTGTPRGIRLALTHADPPTKEPVLAVSLPDATTRWRCGGCGNLTRFDVTRSRRTTEFWHFDLAGDHQIEEATTDQEVVESVTCRWCGRSDAVELVSRAEADAATS